MALIRAITPALRESPQVVGAKAAGLADLLRLGLPVPPGFVITTDAGRHYLRDGRLPPQLRTEIGPALEALEKCSGRRFGGTPPLVVAVRSGAGVSMPGMMDTVLGVGLTEAATAQLVAETGDPRFARDARRRFRAGFESAVGAPVPDDAAEQLTLATEDVFRSWNSPRAWTYRELRGIDHSCGTAVIVQTMVFGNRDARSGTGVAFSRDPSTGANAPFGDVLFTAQGDDVVGGRVRTLPLPDLREREPAIWDELADALRRVEAHYRDAAYLEFTFQQGRLWFLQARPGRFTGGAAIRLAVDLADASILTRAEAVRRVLPEHLRQARVARIAASADLDLLSRGIGASPGVAVGVLATTTGAALRLADRHDVILARPETSPTDLSGLAAARGVVTARGGAASHAAVVARSMGKPAVVGVADLAVDEEGGTVALGDRRLGEGTLVTIDGTSGAVVLGRAPLDAGGDRTDVDRILEWADDISGDRSPRPGGDRLAAALAVLDEPDLG